MPLEILARPGGTAVVVIVVQTVNVLRVAAVHVRLLMQVAVIIQSAVQMIVVGMGNVSVQTQAVIAIRTVIVAARARVTGRLRSVLPAVVVAAAMAARGRTVIVPRIPIVARTIARTAIVNRDPTQGARAMEKTAPLPINAVLPVGATRTISVKESAAALFVLLSTTA